MWVNVRIVQIQGKYQLQKTQLQHVIQEQDNQIGANQYENICLQDEIQTKDQEAAALQRHYVGSIENEDKSNDTAITVKCNEEAEYLYISIFSQHSYRKRKNRVLSTRNQTGPLFPDEDALNVIVTYNFWQERRLIVISPNRSRHCGQTR